MLEKIANSPYPLIFISIALVVLGTNLLGHVKDAFKYAGIRGYSFLEWMSKMAGASRLGPMPSKGNYYSRQEHPIYFWGHTILFSLLGLSFYFLAVVVIVTSFK